MAGVPFRSPVGVAALGTHFGRDKIGDPQGNAEINADILLKHVKAGAGFIAIGGSFISDATLRIVRERCRYEEPHHDKSRSFRVLKAVTAQEPYGVEGIYFHVGPFWVDTDFLRMVVPVKEKMMQILTEKRPEHTPIIANTIGIGDVPESYIDGAKRWAELGADIIELNFSCPTPPGMRGAVEDFLQKRFPPRFQGALLGEHPEIVAEITRRVVKEVSVPVGVKLTAETGFPRIIGTVKAAYDAGAKFVQLTNAGISVPAPDIYHRGKSPWQFADGNFFALASGSWMRMLTYRNVAGVARFVPGIDIAASGGLVTPEQCVEVMMLGASLAQLCTGVIEQGRSLIRRTVSFMRKFMAEQGYANVSDFIGLGQQYIKYQEDVDLMPGKVVISLDESKCTHCGHCVDTICAALYAEKGQIKIKKDKCTGCGGCTVACQPGALKLTLR